ERPSPSPGRAVFYLTQPAQPLLFATTQSEFPASLHPPISRADGTHLDGGSLCRQLGRNEVPDETSCSFNKRDLVGQATLQQDTNGIVSGYVGGCYQRDVLGHPKVDQVA